MSIYNETQSTQIRLFLVYFIDLIFIFIVHAYFIDHRANSLGDPTISSGKLASGKLTLVRNECNFLIQSYFGTLLM